MMKSFLVCVKIKNAAKISDKILSRAIVEDVGTIVNENTSYKRSPVC